MGREFRSARPKVVNRGGVRPAGLSFHGFGIRLVGLPRYPRPGVESVRVRAGSAMIPGRRTEDGGTE